ncbi:hypothetical protein BJX63DRAFT_50749 [Aspergillus granulosus]|uniref:Uncharacterized protein n=1 Tax=Aspergillus granulosus TaxID=176169 RepID=A0ABR4GYC4_9EURO
MQSLARDYSETIGPVLNSKQRTRGLAAVPREGGHVSQMTRMGTSRRFKRSPCGFPVPPRLSREKGRFLVMNLCVSSDMIHHKLSHINLFFEAIEKQDSSIIPPNQVFDLHHLEDLIFTSNSLCKASLCLTGSLVSDASKLRPDRSSPLA